MSPYFNYSLASMALVLLVIALLTSYISPTVSTSSQTFDSPDAKTGFRVTLNHVDSNGNFTKFELLQRALDRGRRRMQALSAISQAGSNPSFDAPVIPGDGEFLMELSIGTPPKPFSAILDTGSDLVWTQCKPCEQCYKQPTPIFDPKKSSSYSKLPCSSDLCESLPTSKCNNGVCEYMYEYGDYSTTNGVMGFEAFTFDKVPVQNIGFGCGHENQGVGFGDGAGLVGMGRGPLSLVSQLDEPKFSYCLTSLGSNNTSTLLVGSKASLNTTFGNTIKTTSLIKSTSSSTSSFYYLSLQGITVGDTALPIDNSTFALQDDGTGGMIIDSGTTITYLEESAFDLLKKEFQKQIKVPVTSSKDMGLDVCFTMPSDAQASQVPKIVFHFDRAHLDLPLENYIIGGSDGLMCLAMAGSGGSGGFSIFGNIQQQNMLVLYDLAMETISFMPTQCDQL